MGVRNCQFVWLPSRVYAHACVLVHVWAWLHWWIHMHLGMIIRMHEYTCEHGRPKLYMHVGTTELSWCMRNIIIITALTRKATIQWHHKRSADKAKAYWFQLLSSKARQTHQKQGRLIKSKAGKSYGDSVHELVYTHAEECESASCEHAHTYVGLYSCLC
jgi:hypothetical protein